jgi:hypothetical protein
MGYEKIFSTGRFLILKANEDSKVSFSSNVALRFFFLTNCLTFVNGRNQISKYFGLALPFLEEYISNIVNF